MTDTAPEVDRDYMLEMERLLREVGPQVLDRWREVLTSGGRQKVHVVCRSCGTSNSTSVEVADTQQQRLILEFLDKRLADGNAAEPRARKLLQDFTDMSSADLADYIATLEAEIAADTPARQRLSALTEQLSEAQLDAASEAIAAVLAQ